MSAQNNTDDIKHIGSLKNTGDRIIVVYRELPDDEDHALVVLPSTLPDRYADRLTDLIGTDIAQSTDDFYDVLHRRTFHDGNTILGYLHQKGYLKKVLVDNINLRPNNHTQYPLRHLNESLKSNSASSDQNEKTVRVTAEDIMNMDRAGQLDTPNAPDKLMPGITEAPVNDNPEAIARDLMAQSHMMMQHAEKLMERAKALNPDIENSASEADSETDANSDK